MVPRRSGKRPLAGIGWTSEIRYQERAGKQDKKRASCSRSQGPQDKNGKVNRESCRQLGCGWQMRLRQQPRRRREWVKSLIPEIRGGDWGDLEQGVNQAIEKNRRPERETWHQARYWTEIQYPHGFQGEKWSLPMDLKPQPNPCRSLALQ